MSEIFVTISIIRSLLIVLCIFNLGTKQVIKHKYTCVYRFIRTYKKINTIVSNHRGNNKILKFNIYTKVGISTFKCRAKREVAKTFLNTKSIIYKYKNVF